MEVAELVPAAHRYGCLRLAVLVENEKGRVVTRWTKRYVGARLTPHKPRHAYGRQCVDLGVDIRIIAEALGHESLESTKIYTRVSFQRTRRIPELFGSAQD